MTQILNINFKSAINEIIKNINLKVENIDGNALYESVYCQYLDILKTSNKYMIHLN